MNLWLAFKASKTFKPVLGSIAILAVLLLVFLLGKCSNHDDKAVKAQVEQTNRSGAAIANAAEMAVGKLEDRRVTDAAVDAAVDQTTTEIGHAQSADAIRAAVIQRMCGEPSHSRDPACIVRPPHP